MFFKQSCSFMIQMCISVPQCCTPIFGFFQNPTSSIHTTIFPKFENGGKSIMVDFNGPRGFFCRAHWAGIVCPISSQSERRCKGLGLPKTELGLNKAKPSGQFYSRNLESTCTSFSVTGSSFMFLTHSSQQQLEPLQQNTNDNYNSNNNK